MTTDKKQELSKSDAIKELKALIGKGKRFRTMTEMAEHLGVFTQNIHNVFSGRQNNVPDGMLKLANLKRVKHPDTYIYIKKQDNKS